MPKRPDINRVLLLGAGPIVIGQACEFDYSGVQACKALKEEGCEIILVNSNPATIMTDPEMADATYVEPITWQVVEKIIEREKPDALLPTMGGQTALNCALDLVKHGVLEKHGVELIGASKSAIDKAEDRDLFRQAMEKIGLDMPRSAIAKNMAEALEAQKSLGFPTIIRPSFTMGGSGGGIAYNKEEFIEICERGLQLSPTCELLIDESVLGWKEFELEVIRDKNDNCIIVCSIENLDPMGVHTGDSITVAPAQTLTDKEYQQLRNAALAVLREIGVETGGSNVQFGINPEDGRIVVIEMNPRVSRSSALASKATGFPIAKVAAKLALGYTLDELKNEITDGAVPASFEPTIDYVVTKIPRFSFEKFPQTEARLTTQMKSVGEVMAIGRTFQESLQKAIRGLETGVCGLDEKINYVTHETINYLHGELHTPGPERLWYIADAFRQGMDIATVQRVSKIDPWFLVQIEELVQLENELKSLSLSDLAKDKLFKLKRKGFSDKRIAHLLKVSEHKVHELREQLEIFPVYKRIDTCAAEFAVSTAYLYSTYGQYCESNPSARKKIMILGGGPNRIGQGIEFDYCCVHAVLALKALEFETIMVNCNPETVSTDYDTANRLYFESLTLEDVLEVVRLEKPDGVIVQYGGQTPLKLASALEKAGVPIIGTSQDAIDAAEDRERFQKLLRSLNIQQPDNATARSEEQAIKAAETIGYPLVVRPSYVLGGRAMEVVYNTKELKRYMKEAVQVSNEAPVLLDSFLEDAIEVDVDAVCDGEDVLIGGIMEHIEQAGVHSGDSACVLPPYSLSSVVQAQLVDEMTKMAKALKVVGLVNAQFAVKGDEIFVLEVNPRASRTIPFISKATGLPLAKIAAKCMVGITLKDQGLSQMPKPDFYAIKQVVFPFNKFPGVDTILGPEMKSTGEVMGIARRFGEAFAKGQLGIGVEIKSKGKAFISVHDMDKPKVAEIAQSFKALGFELLATGGTAEVLKAAGIECKRVNKVIEGRPHILDMVKNDEIDFIVNTSKGKKSVKDSSSLRRNALLHKVSYTTTLAGAKAVSLALKNGNQMNVVKLQEL